MGSESGEERLSERERKTAQSYAKVLAQYEGALLKEKPNNLFQVLKAPGVVFVGCVGGYFLGSAGVGAWALLPLLYLVSFVFLRRIKEFKRGIESFIYFSVRKQTAPKFEKVNWMNEIMEKTWRYAESNISKIALLKVNAILRGMKIPMVNDVRLDRFTLGGHPPVVEGIRVRGSDRESLVVDMSVHFLPSTDGPRMEERGEKPTEEETEKKTEWNSDITFTARIGGGFAGVNMPFTLKNFMFKANVRVKVFLTYDATVVEGVEFSFLKQPEVDFNILPLRIIDIMDIPGLATAVKKSIEVGVAKEALYPKKICVAIKPKSVYYVGVVVVHMHKAVSLIEKEFYIDIGLNGRKGKDVVHVTDPACNFVAHLPIKNQDQTVTIFARSSETEEPLAMASVGIEKICMRGRTQGLLSFSNEMGHLDVSLSYLPKISVEKATEEEKPKSAIITVKIVQLIDMVDLAGKTYKNLSAKVTACLKEKKAPGKNPAEMSAVELMPTETKATSPTATNESSTESDEEEHAPTREQRPQYEVLGKFSTKSSRDTVSPSFDEAFVFYTRDTKRTYVTVEAFDGENMLGTFNVNIRRGVSISYGTFDFWNLNTGKAKIAFSAEYVCMSKIRMPRYTHIRRVQIGKIGEPEVYTGYVVTEGRVVSVPAFFSGGIGKQHAVVLVPIVSTKEISKLVVYLRGELFGGCEIVSGDTVIGEVPAVMEYTDVPIRSKEPEKAQTERANEAAPMGSTEDNEKSEDAPVSEGITQEEGEKNEGGEKAARKEGVLGAAGESGATYSDTEKEEVAEESLNISETHSDGAVEKAGRGVVDEMSQITLGKERAEEREKCIFVQMRVVVCRVHHPIFLEFSKNEVVLDRSAPSAGKKLCGEFFFFTDVSVSVYTVKEGFLIGKFILSKSSGRHEIKLTHGQSFVVDVCNRWLFLTPPKYIQSGKLTLGGFKVQISDLPEIEIFSSVFLEISVKDQTHATEPEKNFENVKFEDVCSFSVFVPLDMLEVRMFAWTLLREKREIGSAFIPLVSLSLGRSMLQIPVSSVYAENTDKVATITIISNLE